MVYLKIVKYKYSILGILSLFSLGVIAIIKQEPSLYIFLVGFIIGVLLGGKAESEK